MNKNILAGLLLLAAATAACGGNDTVDIGANETEWLPISLPSLDFDYDDLGTCREYHLADHRVVMVCEEVDLIIVRPDCESRSWD